MAADLNHRFDHREYMRIFERGMAIHPPERTAMDGSRPDGVVGRDCHAGLVQHTGIVCVIDLPALMLTLRNDAACLCPHVATKNRKIT
jgi:hypothetical protein